jgi:hypothetical protein
MSKESTVPLTRTAEVEKNGIIVKVTFPERFRRYPVERDLREIIGANADSGHMEPPPSARKRR